LELFFLVDGNPTPQGSKTAYVRGGRAVLVEANKKLPAWREAVRLAARLAMYDTEQVEPFDTPLKVAVTFFMPKPAKPKWAIFPASKPDLDKLIRGVMDSLTKAGTIKDDALVVEILAKKVWVGETTDTHPNPGCSVYITTK
jgi:Holliday junction resolvase RusA-like endonuclease